MLRGQIPLELQAISCFLGRFISYMTLSSWNAEGKKDVAWPLAMGIYLIHCESRFIHEFIQKYILITLIDTLYLCLLEWKGGHSPGQNR